MSQRTFELPDIGQVNIYKRRGVKNIRLTLRPGGEIRVTIPAWIPYRAGLEFAIQRSEWILQHVTKPADLSDGARVGHQHRIVFRNSVTLSPRSRINGELITISLPPGMMPSHNQAQMTAIKAATRAIKIEAEAYLPKRLRQLADTHDFNVKSVEVKKLKSRWGSCNQQKEIVLNSFLIQLPWTLIDYVILHELVHTKIMAHGPKFWAELEQYVDDLPTIRRQIKSHRPEITAITATF